MNDIEPIVKILKDVYGVNRNAENLASLIFSYCKTAYELGVERRDYAPVNYSVMDGKETANEYALQMFDIEDCMTPKATNHD